MSFQFVATCAHLIFLFPINATSKYVDKGVNTLLITLVLALTCRILYEDFMSGFFANQPFIVTFISYIRMFLLEYVYFTAICCAKVCHLHEFKEFNWIMMHLSKLLKCKQYYKMKILCIVFTIGLIGNILWGLYVDNESIPFTPRVLVAFLVYNTRMTESLLIMLVYLINDYLNICNAKLNAYFKEALSSKNTPTILIKLNALSEIYIRIFDAIYYFNKIFGFQIFLSTSETLFTLMLLFDEILLSPKPLVHSYETWLQSITLVFSALRHFGQKIKREIYATNRLCMQITQYFDKFKWFTFSRKNIEFVTRHSNRTIEISAADFFAIDHANLFNLFNISVTYLIVFAQYNNKSYQW